MAEILHKIGIKSATLADVYQAITTQKGLAGWWTTDTQGEGNQVNDLLKFRFDAGGFDINVMALTPPNRVLWKVVEGPEEWIGTTINWELKEEGDYIVILFKHMGWKEPVEFMHHCSTKWAIFLMSLKTLIETGKGNPSPHDVKIDNWN